MPPPPPLFTTSCEKMFSHTADRMTVTGCLPLLYTHTPHYIVHISFLRVPLLTFFILDSQKQCSASDGYFAGLKKKKERLPGLYVPWCQLIKGSLHPTETSEALAAFTLFGLSKEGITASVWCFVFPQCLPTVPFFSTIPLLTPSFSTPLLSNTQVGGIITHFGKH